MALKRQQHWETRVFASYLESRAKVPFAWGSNDCLMFAADGLLAICGEQAGSVHDPASGFRGSYTTAAGALTTTQAVTGSADMLKAVTMIASRIGLTKRANPRLAGRGDVVLIEDAERLICGLVGLSGRWVHAPGDTGLRNICILHIRHAWAY